MADYALRAARAASCVASGQRPLLDSTYSLWDYGADPLLSPADPMSNNTPHRPLHPPLSGPSLSPYPLSLRPSTFRDRKSVV